MGNINSTRLEKEQSEVKYEKIAGMDTALLEKTLPSFLPGSVMCKVIPVRLARQNLGWHVAGTPLCKSGIPCCYR